MGIEEADSDGGFSQHLFMLQKTTEHTYCLLVRLCTSTSYTSKTTFIQGKHTSGRPDVTKQTAPKWLNETVTKR